MILLAAIIFGGHYKIGLEGTYFLAFCLDALGAFITYDVLMILVRC